MWKKPFAFRRGERGATVIEYGLIVVLIAVALVAVFTILGGDQGLRGVFKAVIDALPTSTAH